MNSPDEVKDILMNPNEFEASLKAEHFGEIVTINRPVGYALGEHQRVTELFQDVFRLSL